MGTLVFLGILIIGLVLGAKWLRKREQAAFLDSGAGDGALLDKYRVGVGIETIVPQSPAPDQTDPLIIKANQYLKETQPIALSKSVQPTISFQLKEIVLSERHRVLLGIIEDVLKGKFRIFVHLPLKEFVEGGLALDEKKVSYLVCDRHYFNVLGGIDFQNKDVKETDFLREVFSEINKPLILFPKKQIYTEEEVRDKLKIFVGLEQKCPKCSASMEKRKLNSLTEQWLWVCIDYPRCKGHLKAT